MKKFIIFGGLGLVVVTGVVLLSIFGLPTIGLNFLDGERGKVVRGDMTVPITAVGTVEARKLIEIKSKASGQLIRINTVEGAMVKEGEVLAELDPVDEQRNVESRQAALSRATSLLEKARITLNDLKVQLPLATKTAEQRVADAAANVDVTEFQYHKIEKLYDNGKGKSASEQEFISTRSAYNRAVAAKEMAEIDLKVAKQNERVRIEQAKQDVVQAQANVSEAQTALADAKQRLSETTIIAPSNAMVYSILRKEGEMIQSGTMTLGGGTPIMYLADTSSMFVMAQVDEADIGAIRDIAPEYATPGKTQRLSEEEYREKGEHIIKLYEESEANGDKDKAKSENGDDDAEGHADDTSAESRKPDADSNGHSPIEADDPPGTSEVVYSHAGNENTDDDAPKEVRQELEGRPVKVTVEAYRNEEFEGVIERILPDPIQSGGSVSFRVRIRLFGNDVEKLMGLQADLAFETKTQDDVLLVPNEALRSEGTECYVWVPHREPGADRDGSKKVWVKIGETDGVDTVIVSGLKENDAIWLKTPIFTQAEREKKG